MNKIKIKTEYYEDGAIHIETPYINGLRHGVQIWYYDDQSPRWKASYVNGKKHGVQKGYYRDGSFLWETPYVNGIRRPDLLEPENRLVYLVIFGQPYE